MEVTRPIKSFISYSLYHDARNEFMGPISTSLRWRAT